MKLVTGLSKLRQAWQSRSLSGVTILTKPQGWTLNLVWQRQPAITVVSPFDSLHSHAELFLFCHTGTKDSSQEMHFRTPLCLSRLSGHGGNFAVTSPLICGSQPGSLLPHPQQTSEGRGGQELCCCEPHFSNPPQGIWPLPYFSFLLSPKQSGDGRESWSYGLALH